MSLSLNIHVIITRPFHNSRNLPAYQSEGRMRITSTNSTDRTFYIRSISKCIIIITFVILITGSLFRHSVGQRTVLRVEPMYRFYIDLLHMSLITNSLVILIATMKGSKQDDDLKSCQASPVHRNSRRYICIAL